MGVIPWRRLATCPGYAQATPANNDSYASITHAGRRMHWAGDEGTIAYPLPPELLLAARRHVRTASQNENEIVVKSQFCAMVSMVARRVKT